MVGMLSITANNEGGRVFVSGKQCRPPARTSRKIYAVLTAHLITTTWANVGGYGHPIATYHQDGVGAISRYRHFALLFGTLC